MTGRFLACRMVERTSSKEGSYLNGFASDRQYLLFPAGPGEWTLRSQPLSPAERSADSELWPAQTRRELAVSEARLLLKQVEFVSGPPGRVDR
jgi:hypothetical protein